MIQRDYLLRQIQQLGLVLGTILSKLLKLKNQQKGNLEIEVVNEFFTEELDFDIDSLLAIPIEELVTTLINQERFDNINLEILADILAVVGEETNTDKRKQLFERSLTIYEWLDASDTNTFSYIRALKIEKLKEN